MSSRLAAAKADRALLRSSCSRELAQVRETLKRTKELVPELTELISRNGMRVIARGRITDTGVASKSPGPQDTSAWDHLLRMERLFDHAEITLELVQQAAAVRVTDGCISQLAWSNPDKSATHDVFIRVPETSPEEIERVKLRIDQLLGLA